jgi:hypothetical protein
VSRPEPSPLKEGERLLKSFRILELTIKFWLLTVFWRNTMIIFLMLYTKNSKTP